MKIGGDGIAGNLRRPVNRSDDMERDAMNITQDQKGEIEQIVMDILEIEPDELTPTSLFKEDHHADSLLAIEILALLERTYGITIPQSQLARMVNMEGVHAVVAEAPSTR